MAYCASRRARTPVKLAFVASLALGAIGWAASTRAGGGPEGVLLVVNPLSPSSLTIANHYAHWRAIPPDNVFYLPWDPNLQTADIDTFRQRILMPVLETMENRRLGNQIDYVVYSSDFPWGIGLDSDIRKFFEDMRRTEPTTDKAEGLPSSAGANGQVEWPKVLTPVGSLTGLTYLWQAVAAGQYDYLSLESNRYMRPPMAGQGSSPSAGFRGNYQYGAQGEVIAAHGRRYFLSTMLGVTAGRGNSVTEVLEYLKRSDAADATHPKGTVYFLKSADIRSTRRQEWFPAAVDELAKLGVAAEILEGTVPLNKNDVQGAVMGTAAFDWKASGSTILPGAICDNFTSLGGVMSAGAGQTPLSEFLRYGAAASSGTVTEPYSIPNKFPSPLIQVHYARGCTLAEAFYQSVQGPYQLLIVGDPLCRPWANIPQVSVTGIERGAVVRGKLTLKPAASVAGGRPVERFTLFFDGQRVAECKPGATLDFDTAQAADGYHQLRVVAIGPKPIQSQGRERIIVRLTNHGRTIEASLATPGPLHSNMPVTIAVRSPGSIGIIAVQGTRIVGRIAGAQGRIEIPAHTLGAGPVQLRMVGLGDGDLRTNVMAEPIEFVVE